MMNPSLLSDNYIIIPNFFLPDFAIQVGKDMEQYCIDNNTGGDEQAPYSSTVYSYGPLIDMLCLSTVRASRIAGVPLLPTYTYSRVYGSEDVLLPHRDREACEVSITLCLDENGPAWPIYMTKPDGNIASISLFPGDAIMYLGCRSVHWRDKNPLPSYRQAFLHYVKANGPFADEAFEFLKRKQPT